MVTSMHGACVAGGRQEFHYSQCDSSLQWADPFWNYQRRFLAGKSGLVEESIKLGQVYSHRQSGSPPLCESVEREGE